VSDRSGFFTNYVLMSELRTAEDTVEYFLKKQSHKFPVKFLHMVRNHHFSFCASVRTHTFNAIM
jgi:hypothetical protein